MLRELEYRKCKTQPQAFFLARYRAAHMIMPKYIKPSELARICRAAGLAVSELRGTRYHPTTQMYSLSRNPYVNYIFACSA